MSCTLWAHNLAEVEPHSSSRVYQLMDLSNLYLLAYYDIIVFISNLALRFTRINISPIFFTITCSIVQSCSCFLSDTNINTPFYIIIISGILERARGWGVRRPPLHYWGPFSPMFSKKMLNLKRERPPTSFFGKTPLVITAYYQHFQIFLGIVLCVFGFCIFNTIFLIYVSVSDNLLTKNG